MSEFRIPGWVKVAFWICWWLLLIVPLVANFWLGPVDPPIPP